MTDHTQPSPAEPAQPQYAPPPAQHFPAQQLPGQHFPAQPGGYPQQYAAPVPGMPHAPGPLGSPGAAQPRNGLALAALIVSGAGALLGTILILVTNLLLRAGSYDVLFGAQTLIGVISAVLFLVGLVFALLSLRRSAPDPLRWAGYVALGVAAPNLLQLVVQAVASGSRSFF